MDKDSTVHSLSIVKGSLNKSQDIFELAMEHSAIGMALVAPDGTWLKVNQAMCNIVGYTKNELLKADFQKITHPHDLQRDMDYVNRVLSGEIETYSIEKRYYHKDKRIIWGLLTVSLVRDDNHAPVYFISQVQDITEQKENKLLLERKQAELEQFSYRVAHDIRSPIASICQLLGITKEKFNSHDSAKVEQYLDLSVKGMAQLSTYVESILDVAKSNFLPTSNERVNVKSIIDDALARLTLLPTNNEIKIDVVYNAELTIPVNKDKLMLIVNNLLSNAFKYRDKNKQHQRITVTTYNMNGSFKLRVQDNGLGIDAEQQAKLFQMFTRFQNEGYEGTGLGLYMVEKNAMDMGGSIIFQSPEGESGSIFEFSIRNTL